MLFHGVTAVRAAIALCFILILSFLIPGNHGNFTGVTQDQISTHANTLLDNVDDSQPQLDNEVREKLGQPKAIWVIQIPSQVSLPYTDHPKYMHSSSLRPNQTRIRRSYWRFAKIKYLDLKKGKDQSTKKFNMFRWAATTKPKPDLNHLQQLEEYLPDMPFWTFPRQHAWKEMYPACGGHSQSPIDIPVNGLIQLKGVRDLIFINYDIKPKNMTLVHNGQSVVFYGNWERERRPLIYGGAAHSRRYLFYSFTLYLPSEHSVGGLNFPMESQALHISAEYKSFNEAVAASPKDPLAFLGVVNIYKFDTKTQHGIKSLLKTAEKHRNGIFSITPIALSELSPPFKEYACYQGSLTTPPCTESVLWMIRSRSLSVTRSVISLVNANPDDPEFKFLGAELSARRWIVGDEETIPRTVFIRYPQHMNDRKVYIAH